MGIQRHFVKVLFVTIFCLFLGMTLKNDSLEKKKRSFTKVTEQSQQVSEPIVPTYKNSVVAIPIVTTVYEQKYSSAHSPLSAETPVVHTAPQQGIPTRNTYEVPIIAAPLQGIDLAIAMHDPVLASDELKKLTDKEPDEPSKILALVSSLDGKHLDMPGLIPGIQKQDPIQALLIRKALRHQYMTTKNWLLPIAIQDENLEAIKALERKIVELEKVNQTIGFM